jgi:LmbE family N-acetylglucosaminyl deacetylase
MKRILIFEAHSDDCVIGMGGTTQKLHEEGYEIVLVTFTKGETAYSTIDQKDTIIATRKAEGIAADRWINVDQHINWEYGCQNVQNTREVFQDCTEMIRKYQPTYIFTHSPEDKHRDHRNISKIVEEAWWKATEGVLADRGNPFRAEKLFFMEISDLFTHPNLIIDITPYYKRKISAMTEFKSQFDVMKGLVSYVESLAKTRGFLGGYEFGEAFMQSNFLPGRTF